MRALGLLGPTLNGKWMAEVGHAKLKIPNVEVEANLLRNKLDEVLSSPKRNHYEGRDQIDVGRCKIGPLSRHQSLQAQLNWNIGGCATPKESSTLKR